MRTSTERTSPEEAARNELGEEVDSSIANAHEKPGAFSFPRPLQEKQEEPLPIERRMSVVEAFSIMHGWRFIPDEIDLKKRMLYALNVGFESLSLWVYKQILPYIQEFGAEDFRASVLPHLLKRRASAKHAAYEMRKEIETSIVLVVKEAYGQDCDVYFQRLSPALKKQYSGLQSKELGEKHVEILHILLLLALAEVDDTDVRIIEIIVFLSYVLDRRILDYLVSYFHSEKDFLLELLLLRIRQNEIGVPLRTHLSDAQIDGIYKNTERVEYSKDAAKSKARDIILEISRESEPDSARFAVTRCLTYIQCTGELDMLDVIIDHSRSKNKAVRIQCALALAVLSEHAKAGAALCSLLKDRDTDVSRHAGVCLGHAIPRAVEMRGEMVEAFLGMERGREHADFLPDVIIAAKKAGSPRALELYSMYIAELKRPFISSVLLRRLPDVLSLFVCPADILAREMAGVRVRGSPEPGKASHFLPEYLQKQNDCLRDQGALNEEGKGKEEKGDVSESRLDSPQNILSASESADGAAILPLLLHLSKNLEGALAVVSVLPQLSSYITALDMGAVVQDLLRIDPQLKWRYWTSLAAALDQIHCLLSQKDQDLVLESLQALKSHRVREVRKISGDVLAKYAEQGCR